MPFSANTCDDQLYTKRCFVQIKNDDKLVRYVRGSKVPITKGQQKHILLIPVVGESRARDDFLSNRFSNRNSLRCHLILMSHMKEELEWILGVVFCTIAGKPTSLFTLDITRQLNSV
ncbi:hypothetical protein Y032_0472g2074 [Ancylostoma ceylanicum]|uniref:Uncharacterized protein n=1 Tax=Ancylostoma ceylanicum TaxID=53326 RepID=A0A016WWS9_9BILA|nr:hypothetical protein Y032_0472g2074 [Ancylostoma ceylanicum]